MPNRTPKITEIIITGAGVDTQNLQRRDHTIIRGSLQPNFFRAVVRPNYQRQVMENHAKRDELVDALDPEEGIGIPDDMLLCCRTDEYTALGGGEVAIHTAELISADGLQRVSAGQVRMNRLVGSKPLGVKIILGTTVEEEMAIFWQVNRKQTKVATHVHLRNSGTNPAIHALRNMTETYPDLVSVQWDHVRLPGTQITAHMLYEVAILLHGEKRPAHIEDILSSLESVAEKFGTERLAENVETFFRQIKRCFEGSDKEAFMYRADLLRATAKLFSDHHDFWSTKDPDRLVLLADDARKLGKVRWRSLDTSLRQSNATSDLYQTLVRHMNSGRDKKLTTKVGV